MLFGSVLLISAMAKLTQNKRGLEATEMLAWRKSREGGSADSSDPATMDLLIILYVLFLGEEQLQRIQEIRAGMSS